MTSRFLECFASCEVFGWAFLMLVVVRRAWPRLVSVQSAAPQLSAGVLRPRRPLCSSSIDEESYHRYAECTLEALQDVFDERADADERLAMDVEYAVRLPLPRLSPVWHTLSRWNVCSQDGVLNVVVGNDGTFVLNKQAPNLQLWVSSPVSGPLRYDFCPTSHAWVGSRDRHDMLALLADDFEELTGQSLSLEAVKEELGAAAGAS